MSTKFSNVEVTRRTELRRFGILVLSVLTAVSFTATVAAFQDQPGNITLRLYLGEKSTDGNVEVNVKEAGKLVGNMDLNRPTFVYVHGFSENVDSESVRTVVDAHLRLGGRNVLAVGFGDIAGENYVLVAMRAPEVGRAVAKAIDELVRLGLNAEGVEIVGHSLGGQVAGYVGRNVGFRLSRITGLDPAGPLFYAAVEHLTSADAKFVAVIHTDAGFYGNAMESGGGADFYANAGTRFQPGCPVLSVPYSDDDFCSHHRSWYYYAESVTNREAFVGIRCDNWWKFKSNGCKKNGKVIMGHGTPNGTRGSFYLETRSSAPFGRGKDGVKPVADFW